MYWGLFNCYFDLAFWTDVARHCALVHILILCQYLHHVLGGTMCIYMQVAPSALTLQCRRHNVPKAHQGLSSGGASSLLAAGCLMHTHTLEQKQCKTQKNMTIYIGMEKNVNLQVAAKSARKQVNKKMGFHNRSVFTLVFDEPADSVITSVANITTWCRSNWCIADCWLLISRYICIVGQCNKWTQW